MFRRTRVFHVILRTIWSQDQHKKMRRTHKHQHEPAVVTQSVPFGCHSYCIWLNDITAWKLMSEYHMVFWQGTKEGRGVVWVFNFRSLTRPARRASIFEASRNSEQTLRERRCLASHWNWGALSKTTFRDILYDKIIRTITLVERGWGSPAAHRGPSTSNLGFSKRARSPDHPSPLLCLCTCKVF